MTAHRVDLTGDDKTTIYGAARRLLATGARPGETIETWHDGKLSMSGRIGELAKWTVIESDRGNPSLMLRPYRPFPSLTVRARAAETASPARV